MVFIFQGPSLSWSVGKQKVTKPSRMLQHLLSLLEVPVPAVMFLLEKLGFLLKAELSGFP